MNKMFVKIASIFGLGSIVFAATNSIVAMAFVQGVVLATFEVYEDSDDARRIMRVLGFAMLDLLKFICRWFSVGMFVVCFLQAVVTGESLNAGIYAFAAIVAILGNTIGR